jgi:hypothetical protein
MSTVVIIFTSTIVIIEILVIVAVIINTIIVIIHLCHVIVIIIIITIITYEPMLLRFLTLELEAPWPAIVSTACQIYGSYLSTSLALATHACCSNRCLTLKQMHIEKEG